MPQKHCHYDFDFCPRCGCTEGSPFLRRWAREERPKQKKIFDEQHNLIAIETIEEEEWDINRVRSKMGLPPLGKNGLIELENTNREVRTYMIAIAQRWDALGITFPLFIRKYPELLKEFDIQRITNVYYKLLKPIKDRRTSGDWDRWLDIGYWVTTQGYSAASKKTAVKNWSGRTNQISVTQIKKKLPLVHAFATEIVADLPKYMEFTKKILGICVSDYELGKLFFASYHLITLNPLLRCTYDSFQTL